MRKIWEYLKDWRNLLTHSLIGVGLVAAALFIPVKPIYRIIGFCAVIAFNIVRMRLSKKQAAGEE